jgi:predicted Zn-dependent peptidase
VSSRRDVTGIIAMSVATQAGLGSQLASLVANDLDPSYVEHLLQDLVELDVEAVPEMATRALGPVEMTTVVVGDTAANALSPSTA